jgi:hypothetical protein
MFFQNNASRTPFAATEDSLLFPNMLNQSSELTLKSSLILKHYAVFQFHVHDREGLFFKQPIPVVEADRKWQLLESLQGTFKVVGAFFYKGELRPAILKKVAPGDGLRLIWMKLSHPVLTELENLSQFGTVGITKRTPELLAAEDFTRTISAGMFFKGLLRNLGVTSLADLEANPLRTSSALLKLPKGDLAIAGDYLHIGQCNTLPKLGNKKIFA